MHRKHSVASAKERNSVFLSTEITLLSVQKKETLFSMHMKHFDIFTKERNTVFCVQETLCCQCKRMKYYSLYTRNTLLSTQKKEMLVSVHKKHFVV